MEVGDGVYTKHFCSTHATETDLKDENTGNVEDQPYDLKTTKKTLKVGCSTRFSQPEEKKERVTDR